MPLNVITNLKFKIDNDEPTRYNEQQDDLEQLNDNEDVDIQPQRT